MFERPQGSDAAILVQVGGADRADSELAELARSAGAQVRGVLSTTRSRPDPRYFLGRGKVDELGQAVRDHKVDLVIFGVALRPSQERNLERELSCRVLDRTGLILDIFAQRAASYEGKLQVELAQLEHLSTRLVRGWTHLERQKGGIGLRGPGETQLETDRRLLGHRIKQIRVRLEQVRARRGLSRRARQRASLPVVSLVGYTNAGKSTLFNRLTGAEVLAEDKLFATLDPTFRRLNLPGGVNAVLADTVGFVSRLPHDLVAAFEATLEESRQAALLLHVVDAADPEREAKKGEVYEVLSRIDASEVPVLEIYNKIDDLDGVSSRVDLDEHGAARRVWLSAHSGEGLDALAQAMGERLQGEALERWIRVPWVDAALRAAVYERLDVLEETVDEDIGWRLRVRASKSAINRLSAAHARNGGGKVDVVPADGVVSPVV
ncbi:MAG: GTPase HflX [Chromatiales bacterium]|nr:GTPase HflX [Chromatiales bacterium]